MIYQPDFELSRIHVDGLVAEHTHVFHADSRIEVDKGHVQLYCADYFRDRYFVNLGRFDNPEAEVERIKQLPTWQHAMRSFSAAGMVGAAIASTPKFRG